MHDPPDRKFIKEHWIPYELGKFFKKEGADYSEDKIPHHHLETFWIFCTPFLYGTIGASIELNKIASSIILKACAIIIIAIVLRWLVSYLATRTPKLTEKESLFLAFA